MNEWDRLDDIFGCGYTDGALPAYAADNICIAWPSITGSIDRFLPQKQGLKALDFGCGGGLFCTRLHEMGFRVTGYDNAEDLVKSARRNTPQDVVITHSPAAISAKENYHLITAVMVFQFIGDIEATVDALVKALAPGGLVISAVFNPRFVEDNLDSNSVFSGFRDNVHGSMELRKDVRIPVFKRTAKEYRTLLARHGCREMHVDYPGFTPEFLRRYPLPWSTTYPEYLIQTFSKSSPR